MKVWNADNDINESISCTLVEFAGLQLMFDCGVGRSTFCGPLDKPLALRVPRIGEVELGGVDAVFITSWEAAAGIPFLTERQGYDGPIYMTEPVYFTARRMLRELAEQEARMNYSSCAGQADTLQAGAYTVDEVEAAFRRVTPVNYGEKIDILSEACAQCASSGHEIGGAYWAVETVEEKVVYLGDVALSASGRHPLPFDSGLLQGADVAVVDSSPRSRSATKEYRKAVEAVGSFASRCVQEGRRVLIPCFPLGAMYDLVEYVKARVFGANSVVGTSVGSQHRVLVVSPAASDLLQFSGVVSEWVEYSRAVRAFVPTELFAHTTLAKTGHLKCVDALAGNTSVREGGMPFEPLFDRPSIVFCSHPSCRFFDAQHLLKLFLNDKNSDMCFVDPEYTGAALSVLSSMRSEGQEWGGTVLVEPLDPRPTPEELGSAIDELGVKAVVCVGKAEAAPPVLVKAELLRLSETGSEPERCAVLALEPRSMAAELTPTLAQSIHLSSVNTFFGGSERLAEFCCSVRAERGKYVLDVVKEDEEGDGADVQRKRAKVDEHFFGIPRAQKVVVALAAKGADMIEPLEMSTERTVLRVGHLGTLATVVLGSKETTIVSGSEELRGWITNIIESDCLHTMPIKNN